MFSTSPTNIIQSSHLDKPQNLYIQKFLKDFNKVLYILKAPHLQFEFGWTLLSTNRRVILQRLTALHL